MKTVKVQVKMNASMTLHKFHIYQNSSASASASAPFELPGSSAVDNDNEFLFLPVSFDSCCSN